MALNKCVTMLAPPSTAAMAGRSSSRLVRTGALRQAREPSRLTLNIRRFAVANADNGAVRSQGRDDAPDTIDLWCDRVELDAFLRERL